MQLQLTKIRHNWSGFFRNPGIRSVSTSVGVSIRYRQRQIRLVERHSVATIGFSVSTSLSEPNFVPCHSFSPSILSSRTVSLSGELPGEDPIGSVTTSSYLGRQVHARNCLL